jgi:hypothetical protein
MLYCLANPNNLLFYETYDKYDQTKLLEEVGWRYCMRRAIDDWLGFLRIFLHSTDSLAYWYVQPTRLLTGP